MGDAVVAGDDQALLALRFLAKGHRARHFGEHAGILRAAGFKEFGNARQTAGNVSGLLRFDRDAGENLTHADLLAVTDNHEGADRQLNRHGMVRARDLHFIAVFVNEVNQRTQDAGVLGLALALGGRGGALRSMTTRLERPVTSST